MAPKIWVTGIGLAQVNPGIASRALGEVRRTVQIVSKSDVKFHQPIDGTQPETF